MRLPGSRDGMTEAFRRQADGDAGDAAVADQQVRADADDGYRNVRIQILKKEREVIGIGRLEQKLGRPADAEPGERRQRRVLGQPAADAGEVTEAFGAHGEDSSAEWAASMASMAASSGSRSLL